MANAAMLIIAYFSAHLLNFGDFARSGKSEAAMKMGNLAIETYLPPPANAPGQ
jgi:nucleobase:cation symporter-1, NCS1 family